MASRNQKSLRQMVDEIDALKKDWLKKQNNRKSLEVLSAELYNEILTIKDEKNIGELKFYLQSKVKLDCNVETSTSILKEIGNLLVTSMVSLTTFVLSFIVSENAKLPQWASIGFACVGLLSFIGLVIMGISITKKHMGTYAREKSFYELCLLVLDEVNSSHI